MTAVLERPTVKEETGNPGEPISFLHAEGVRGFEVIDQPHPDIVAENDTLIQGSGDSDTI